MVMLIASSAAGAPARQDYVSRLVGGTIEVNVTRVGFPTLQRGDVVRSGAWVPVTVDLALLGKGGFDGSIRVGQFDTDGDECYDSVDVHLRAETAGARRVHLYALANPLRSQGRFIVELASDEGDAVKVVNQGELTFQARPAQRPAVITDDEILILSISTEAIGRVQDLVNPDQRNSYSRPLAVGHMSPADLPELWIALEMVDYIVWDDARPDELTGRQLDALLEWVRQGGTLLVAASRTAGSLAMTKSIARVLPVDVGDLIAVDNLPGVRKALLAPRSGGPTRRRKDDLPWWEVPFVAPVPVVQGTLREGSSRVPAAGARFQSRTSVSNVVTRRREGWGNTIFCAVTLRDLFSAAGSPADFFRRLFHLSLVTEGDAALVGGLTPATLFPSVVSAVAFTTSGGLYLLGAGVFSVSYVLIATFGSWALLGARGWRRYSWSAFAVLALAASLLSVIAVKSMRGFGEALHQISIVDVEAGKANGRATAFFGLKTGTDRVLDVWLPSDPLSATEPGVTNCFLRPMPAGNDPTTASTSFADPVEYGLVPASAVVDDVRIRATLKQFEGRWQGSLGGTLTAKVSIRGRRILDGSYIVNNLGVDLHDCYLLHPVLGLDGQAGSRSGSIYAYPIGKVPSDGRKIELAPLCYRTRGDETITQLMARSTLAEAQKTWGSSLSGVLSRLGRRGGSDAGAALGEEENALLLASTVGEYDPTREAGMAQYILGFATWSRDRLGQLDLRDQLRRDSVILIGFADDPGPVRLFGRSGGRPYRMLEPDPRKSWTMYRARIPATLYGGSGWKEGTDEEATKPRSDEATQPAGPQSVRRP